MHSTYRSAIALIVIAFVAVFAGCTQQTTPPPASAAQDGDDAEAGETAEVAEAAMTKTDAEASKRIVQPAAPMVAAPSVAVDPPAPQYVVVGVPAGTELEVELLDTLSSGISLVGDPVRARLSQDLYADGRLVASAGAQLHGTVTEVVPLKKFGGQPSLTFSLESLAVEGGSTAPMVAWFVQQGPKQAGRDAAKIGGGAAAGAIIGHQVDDDKGSKIGALIGGAIGTAVAAKTGKEVELIAGTLVVVPLENEMRVRLES